MRKQFIGMLMSATLLTHIFSCGGSERISLRRPPSQAQIELNMLKERVQELELFAGTFTSSQVNPFDNCEVLVVPLEIKICQIAQTATATQQFSMKTQLSEIAKQFQTSLYGDDCTDAVVAGCPAASSIKGQIVTLQASVDANTASILTIQTQLSTIHTNITALTARLDALDTRLNRFNGTTSSIEVVIAGIQNDVDTLKSDVANIKGIIEASRTLIQVLLCADNPDSGPVYETMMMTGDHVKAYVSDPATGNLSLIFTAGDPDETRFTRLNTKKCRYKIYNDSLQSKIQACWVPTDRNASGSQIDSARASGTATCTEY